jgi:hypothetical protein
MFQLAPSPGIIAASSRGPVAAGLGFGAGPREFCSRSYRVSQTGYPGWSGSCVAFWIEAGHEIVQENFMRGGF